MNGLIKVGQILFKVFSFIFMFELLRELNKVFDSFENDINYYQEQEKKK